MAKQSINLDISEGEIQNAIAVALAEAFGPSKRDALIRDVMRAHLSIKKNSYDRETLLSKVVGDQIRKYATTALEEIFESEMKDKIQSIVKAAMGDEFKESVYGQVKKSVSNAVVSGIRVTCDMDFDEE